MGYTYTYRMLANTPEQQERLLEVIDKVTANFNKSFYGRGKSIEIIDKSTCGVLVQVLTLKDYKSPIKSVQSWTRALTAVVSPENIKGKSVFNYFEMEEGEKKLFAAYNSSNLLSAVLAIFENFDVYNTVSDSLWSYLVNLVPDRVDELVREGDKIRQEHP